MKIAFFIRSMTNGGAEKVAAQLTRIWSRLGHQTILLSELPEKPGEMEYECEYIAREFVGGDTKMLLGSFESLHRQYGFDAVVFNDAINNDWFRSVFDKVKSLGLRTVIVNHHTANNWMYGCCNTRELFMDDIFAQADAMVCVDRMWALWWKYRGVKAVFVQNPVSVEELGVESGGVVSGGVESGGVESGGVEECKRERVGALSLVRSVDEAVEKLRGKKRIVWVGRLGDALKRPEVAIEVFSKLVWELVSGGVEELPTLTMLGTCSKATEKRLRKLFTTLLSHPPSLIPHPSALLSFPGFVTNVGEYLAKADAHLFTSATEGTVPQVVLEAQAAGVETVAFDMPVLRGVVSGGVRSGGVRSGRVRSGGIEEKWRKVLAGEDVECDFDTPEVRQNLMDELHRSQQWFATYHLPELMAFRRMKMRISPRYLLRRLLEKIVFSARIVKSTKTL